MGLVHLAAVLLWRASVAMAVCGTPTFTCYEDRLTTVSYNNFDYACPTSTICNRFNLDPCSPCVSIDLVCSKRYQCTLANPTAVSLIAEKVTIYCPDGYQCNSDYELPCNLCVRSSCPTKTFECDPNDRSAVWFGGLQTLYCRQGYVCNERNVQPCWPCVPS